MLILTRRKNQKVVFPTLGITVKVVDVSGKTIRLGIDAPREIRVIRDELGPLPLEEKAKVEPPVNPTGGSASVRYGAPAKAFDNSGTEPEEGLDSEKIEVLVRQLDAANLALHLAQNQLRQGRSEYADESLQHAIDCLQEIEASAGLLSAQELAAVREPSEGYTVKRKRTALLLEGRLDDRLVVAKKLEESGMLVSLSPRDRGLDLITAMQFDTQPDLVLFLGSDRSTSVEPDSAPHNAGASDAEIALPTIGLGSLRTMTRAANVDIAGCFATAWISPDFCLSKVVS
jgi:carbon storage regulator CsrA